MSQPQEQPQVHAQVHAQVSAHTQPQVHAHTQAQVSAHTPPQTHTQAEAQVHAQEQQEEQEIWTIKAILDWMVSFLTKKGDEHPRLSAEYLISYATGLSRVELYAYFDRPLSPEERDLLRAALKRRAAGEPLQYVSGETAFRHIVLKSQQGVLIPRPETELLVELALNHLRSSKALAQEHEKNDELNYEAGDELKDESSAALDCVSDKTWRVLEVGTGTACIALSLASEFEPIHVTATEISEQAFELAQRNRAALGLEDKLDLIACDLVEGLDDNLKESFDLLISNPPYIPHDEMKVLPQEVASFEPHLALDGGEDGLDVFRRLLHEASSFLKPGGFFAVELHETKLYDAAKLSLEYYEDIEVHKDLAGRDRFLTAVKRCSC